ncbi:ankyrin repeat domain-containing protein [Bacillus sp. J14TS2]|uniref:ankyrin repeat domain-containing protein n=1 Tax=Bacillus sp. J14TS2 TaxID=2807188 RepID=UPI00279587E3|nr:ankyrin repeat domain-containing protein [Bacillus sp. J14TS2]
MILLAACQTDPDHSKPLSEKVELNTEEDIPMNQNQFILAAGKGDVEEVLRLLEKGVDIDGTDAQGRTAVVAATYGNHIEVVEVLIDKGADINIRDNQLNNVFLYAGASGYLDIVKLAIAAEADTTLTNRFGGTALIPAAERGHVEVVKELLKNSDVDVNHINDLQWTALMEAVILGDGGKNHQDIVQLLVDHGADIKIGDGDGVTPLEHAQRLGFQEIEQILKNAAH